MRICILGGTFDPPHFGHLNLAEEARTRLNLNQVFFVPAAGSPLKETEVLSPALVRYRMTRLAVRNHPGFEVSDVDIRRSPPSYTVDTLKEFQKQFPFPHELFFLAGADAAKSLQQWKDIHIILEMCCFVVAARPGFKWANLPDGVLKLEINEVDISASEIRNKCRRGEDINDLVPYRVLQLIEKEALYRK